MSDMVIAVRLDDIKRVGANAALVLQQIRYTAQLDQNPFKEGWTPMPRNKCADVTGLSEKACRSAINRLIEAGMLEAEKLMAHRGNQTMFYRVPKALAPEGQSLAPEGQSSLAPEGQSTIYLELRKKEEKSASDHAETIWQDYPRKVDKAKAITQIIRRIQEGTPPEHLQSATLNYADWCHKSGRHRKHILHGTTFYGPSGRWQECVDGHPEPIEQDERTVKQQRQQSALDAWEQQANNHHQPSLARITL